MIVIRFGEHQILDEATVKKFGDELFQVAERLDCEKLLLDSPASKGSARHAGHDAHAAPR